MISENRTVLKEKNKDSSMNGLYTALAPSWPKAATERDVAKMAL
jgi:hypothetical protein